MANDGTNHMHLACPPQWNHPSNILEISDFSAKQSMSKFQIWSLIRHYLTKFLHS